MWSNQTTKRFGFKIHVDGAAPGTWSADEVPASQSADDSLGAAFGMADDHMNVKVAADGTLYAAVKTSYDKAGYTRIALLVRRPNGIWDDLYEVDEAGTRGLVVINEASNLMRIVYTSTEGFAPIVYKQSTLSSISFGQRQTMMASAFNDVTSTKQNWTDSIVAVASNSTNSIDGVIFGSPGSGNTAPVAVADSYSTPQNTPLTVAAGRPHQRHRCRQQPADGGPRYHRQQRLADAQSERQLHVHPDRGLHRTIELHLPRQRRHGQLEHRDRVADGHLHHADHLGQS